MLSVWLFFFNFTNQRTSSESVFVLLLLFLQVRFYPRSCNLDNAFALNVKLPAPAFLVNVFRSLLLVYCSDSRVVFFSLERTDDDPSKSSVYH